MSLSRPTILLVDDEPEILGVLQAGIERGISGAQVLTAPTATLALETLARKRVDVIISDQRMPGMAGIDFLVEARRLAPSTHRIMLTAFPEQNLIERDVNEAHVAHFFRKPYRLSDVIAVLERLLSQDRSHDAEVLALARAIANAGANEAPISFKRGPVPFRGALEH